MSSYYVMPLAVEDNDFIWCVMENQTGQLIRAFEFEDDAKKYNKFLSRGGAFDGHTPSFILQEVASLIDVNQEFSSFISN